MTRREQTKFVQDLSRRIADEIVDKIKKDKVPADWNGHELRCLLSMHHVESARMTAIIKEPRGHRAREFKNTVLINNL